VKKNEKGEEAIAVMELPTNVRRAETVIALWEDCMPREYHEIASSISRHALQSGGTVLDEPWFGSEAAEKAAFVTEELYIHSKLMIVDDRKVRSTTD
jgi:phospholipase D1/2